MIAESLPTAPGVYLMRDHADTIIYVGKAKDLRKRVGSYVEHRAPTPKVAALVASIRQVDYIVTPTEREALLLERRLIHDYQPKYNADWKDDKAYPYIKLTLQEDFPRLVMTRRVKRDGAKYFGPFPSGVGLGRFLRFIKRLFPLRSCNYHIGQCSAPCEGRVTKADYKQTVQSAEQFVRGDYAGAVSRLEGQMKDAARGMQYEVAGKYRDDIAAIRQVTERIRFRRVNEEDLARRVEAGRAITDLQKALGMVRPPVRMECVDISGFQGQEAVGSLVVFDPGQPLKAEYRRYRIKTVAGQDDPRMVGEVVSRRARRWQEGDAKVPDLLLIDGGPTQLTAAVRALAVSRVLRTDSRATSRVLSSVLRTNSRVPVRMSSYFVRGRLCRSGFVRRVGAAFRPPVVASLAKREELLYLPGRTAPVALPHDAPALHLVQRIRDEAHRFAITYHRLLRDHATLAG